jgi:hypothetical protein
MRWTDVKKLYLLVLLFFIQLTLDINTNECFKRTNSLKLRTTILSNLTIHHAISVFTNFGWIFNDKRILRIYILFPVLVIVHWFTNDDKCFLTQQLNKICDYTHYEYFHDFTYFLNIKSILPFYKVFIIAINLYKLVG